MAVAAGTHPLDPLTADEIRAAVAAAQAHEALADKGPLRFNFVTLNEPPKPALRAFAEGGARPPREAEVLLLTPQSSAVYRLVVALPDGGVAEFAKLEGVQPLASPDECFLAEDIVKKDPKVQALMKERYGVEDMGRLVCDPWSVHHCGDTALTEWRGDGAPGRLIQAFLYLRDDADDNHYAHPLDMVPVVDLYKEVVFSIFKQVCLPPPATPAVMALARSAYPPPPCLRGSTSVPGMRWASFVDHSPPVLFLPPPHRTIWSSFSPCLRIWPILCNSL